MKRYIREGGEALNERLTDEMIDEANAIVSKDMDGRVHKEVMERVCEMWGSSWKDRFSINCVTSYEYRTFKFRLNDDNTVEFLGIEGDFRD